MTSRNPLTTLIFLSLFSLVFLGVFYVFGSNIVRQYRAESFPSVPGRIQVSRTIIHRGKGVSYSASFRYTYEVDGVTHQGCRYRYGNAPSDWPTVHALVLAHPVGSTTDVFYDPAHPASSLLAPKVIHQDIALLFFMMTPGVFFLFLILRNGEDVLKTRNGGGVAGGVDLRDEVRAMTTRVRLPRFRPSGVALVTTGSLLLISGLFIQFGAVTAPVMAGMEALLLTAIAGLAAFFWQSQRLASGFQDLVIDGTAQTLELPLTYKRKQRRPIPFSEVREVTLESVSHKTKNGVFYTYAPTLVLADGTTERLTDLNEKRAAAFADWLRKKLDVSV